MAYLSYSLLLSVSTLSAFFPNNLFIFHSLLSCFIACSSKEVIEASPVSMNGMHFFKEKCLQLCRHFSFLIVCKHLFSVYCKTLDFFPFWNSLLISENLCFLCKNKIDTILKKNSKRIRTDAEWLNEITNLSKKISFIS